MNGPVGAADGHRPDRIGARPDAPEPGRERVRVAIGHLHRVGALQGAALRGERRLVNRLARLAGLGLGADMPAEDHEAVVGVTRADRGLDKDPEQRLAVEAGGERIADPADRVLDLQSLTAQLVHLLAEPLTHLVELVRESRHLVVAGNRTFWEKSPEPIRRAAREHLANVALQGAHDRQHRDDGDRDERDQRDRDCGARPEDPGVGDRRKDPDADLVGPERLGRREPEVIVPVSEVRGLAALRQGFGA